LIDASLAPDGPTAMSHELAKTRLEKAETPVERREAVKAALSLGMSLSEIEEYLDWLDFMRSKTQPQLPGQSRSKAEE
jgi:DNA-binding transcriptional MerR regulator